MENFLSYDNRDWRGNFNIIKLKLGFGFQVLGSGFLISLTQHPTPITLKPGFTP
jgi:hypothetical protein